LGFQEKSDDHFSKLHAWIVENLTSELSTERLAEEAGMSVRTFVRRYKEAVGCTPARTVEAIKLEVACEGLSNSSDSIKQIARASGFGDQQNMRRAFIRSFGVSPKQYREQHNSDGEA
jgi:transcriptional regulator GlxA family with amidase domain